MTDGDVQRCQQGANSPIGLIFIGSMLIFIPALLAVISFALGDHCDDEAFPSDSDDGEPYANAIDLSHHHLIHRIEV